MSVGTLVQLGASAYGVDAFVFIIKYFCVVKYLIS